MDTAETRTEMPEAGRTVYDGFMSYSHAADDLLAPRLQSSLQRFAKPWWRRRAVRVFRDEASLSANPHLWSSITEALDGSGWFVLLLSPDAAESPWVNREVEYWLEHKDSDRIIPVLTEGEFAWSDGDFVSDAAPPALQGAFSDEPRWVDLRFARSEEQLDLNNPGFSAAVADIASALRGVPKDELESEEVKQHRRTIRTAWGSGIALLLLLVLATAAAVFAVGQRNEAQENERIAFARELAAASIANLDKDPQRSILLALEAVETTKAVDGSVLREAQEALHRALLDSRVELILGELQSELSLAAVFSPDGQQLAMGGSDGSARIVGAFTGAEVQSFAGHTEPVADVKWSPDASELLTTSLEGRSILWDVSSGELLQIYEGGVFIGSFSPDGQRVAASSPDAIYIWDKASADLLLTIPYPEPLFPVGIAFDPVTGDRIALALEGPGEAGAGVVILDSETGEELVLMPIMDGACELRWSPDGTRVASASAETVGSVWDAQTGEEISRFEKHHSFLCTVDFSSDGELVVTGGDDGSARVWEAATGKEVVALTGHEQRVGFASFSPDVRRVVTSSQDGTIRVWNITPEGRREQVAVPDPSVVLRSVYSSDGTHFVSSSFSGVARMWDSSSAAQLRTFEGHESWIYSIDYSSDGTVVATGSRDFTAKVWEAETGRILWDFEIPIPVLSVDLSPTADRLAVGTFGSLHLFELSTGEETFLAEGGQFFGIDFSPDGTLLAAGEFEEILVFEVASARRVAHIDFTGPLFEDVQSLRFNADGTKLLSGHRDGSVRIWDLATEELVLGFEGHTGLVWDASFSPDQSMVASASFDGTVRLWDARTGEELLLLEDSNAFTTARFSPDGKRLLVSGDFGARIYEIDVNNLIEVAQSRLLRWWTPDECFQFLQTDECPPPPAGTEF